jgi:hypothetical protein
MQVLRENHALAVSCSFIGRVLGIDKGTVKCHSKRSEAVGAALGRNGHPSVLSGEPREDVFRQIEEVCHHDIPGTIAEILQVFQERATETVAKNNFYH